MRVHFKDFVVRPVIFRRSLEDSPEDKLAGALERLGT
jgi:hypothetical protein